MKARTRENTFHTDREVYEMLMKQTEHTAMQTEAMMLYAMSLHGYGTKRLQRAHEWLVAVMRMPEVMGKAATTEDCILFMQKMHGIDFTQLSPKLPTYEQYMGRDGGGKNET